MRAFIHLLETGKPKNPRYVQDNDLLPDGHPAVRKKNPSKRASKPREIVFVAAGMLQPFFASKSGKNKAVSFLKNLHKKYEPYLISSMPYEEVDEFWREEKLYRYFRDFYTSDTQTQYGWLKGRDWTFLADSPRKSKFVTEWMNRLNKSSKGTFKNISNLKWEGAAKREKNPSIARDVLHEMLYEVSPDYSRELFAEYYEVSAEDPEKLLLQYPEPPSKYYYGRNFVWIGDPGRMLKLYAEDVVPIDGNIFYPEKLTAVASVSQWNDGDKIPLIPGYGIPVIMDEERIEEAFEYQEYDLYYRPDYDDDGEILVQVRDGNHRTFGALLSGEPYVYVKVDSSTYRDYENWVKSGGRLDNVDDELMHYLNANLE